MRSAIIIVCTAVLVFAGLAKLFTTTTTIGDGLHVPSMLLYYIAIFEIGIGFWLVAEWRQQLAISCALWFFFAAFAFSLVRIWAGQESCDCFGAIRTPTFLAAGISLVCATGLTVAYRSANGDFRDGTLSSWGSWCFSMIGGGLLLGSLVPWLVGSGSVEELVNRLDQKSIAATAITNPLRTVDYCSGFTETFEFDVQNLSEREVRLVGVSVIGCLPGGMSVRGMPTTLAPRATGRVTVTVFRPPIPSQHLASAMSQYLTSHRLLEHENPVGLRILTDVKSQPFVDVRIGFVPSMQFLERVELASSTNIY